jgi:hypothetical protein
MLSSLPCTKVLEPLGNIKTYLVMSERYVLQEDYLAAEYLTGNEDEELYEDST